MKLKDLSSPYYLLLTSFGLAVLVFAFRGGYPLWSVNRVMILWTEQLVVGANADGISISDSHSIKSAIPSSAALSFGRIAFAQEKYQDALNFYQQAADLTEYNPIVQAEKVISLSRTEQFEDAITFYESKGDAILWKREAQDALLFAYLQQLDAGQITIADNQNFFDRFAAQELYALSLLLQQEFGVRQLAELPDQAQKKLRQFSIDTIAPGDARLLRYTTRLLPELIESGIWDSTRLQNVLQFWVWQYPDSPVVEEVIEKLSRSYPEIIDWENLRNELIVRRNGQRLEMPLPTTMSVWNDAANMIGNGRFDQLNHDGLVGWHVADYITGRGEGPPTAAFSMNVDKAVNVTPPYALRIDGIWGDGATGFFGALAIRSRVEGSYFLSLLPQQAYQLSGYYRTRGESERVSMYIGNPTARLLDTTLPATAGEWQMFNYTACHGSEETESMQLLLRLHNSGTVWFDNLMLQPTPIVDSSENCLP
jgi:tetratricopeptide (TPR) repeat protein